MTDEGKKLQQENIKKSYRLLKEEGVVTNKDAALHWIFEITQNYDGAETIGEHRAVIDELAAYALLGKECID
jgi:hypothetical protein